MTGFHLGTDKRATLDEAAALVPSGATVALGGGLCARLPMALVRALVRAGRDELHVVGSAHSIDVDLLIAAGAVGCARRATSASSRTSGWRRPTGAPPRPAPSRCGRAAASPC